MLSTVTGVAPFVSYTRTLFKDWKEGRFAGDHQFYLLNGASRSWEFGYREELEKFAEQAPWFTLVSSVSRPWEDDRWKGEVGRVDELLRKYADQEMDLADACIVRMTELMRDSRVVTLDRADFSVYRRNGRDLIPIIAPPA